MFPPLPTNGFLAAGPDLRISGLGREHLPDSLRNVIPSRNPSFAESLSSLAQEWRNRRDIASSYPASSYAIGKALHLDSIDFTDSALESVETFASLEKRLLTAGGRAT